MWVYKKMLEYPADVTKPDPVFAKSLFSQFGGPDSELSAALRYFSQAWTMPIPEGKSTLISIGTEEMAHWEIVGTLIYKLIKGVPVEELVAAGLGAHYSQHDRALYPHDAAGVPWMAAYIQSLGDPIADIHEDLAAEEKARATYEHLIDQSRDPKVIDTLSFLRQREIVHFQRFGEVLDLLYDYLDKDRRDDKDHRKKPRK